MKPRGDPSAPPAVRFAGPILALALLLPLTLASAAWAAPYRYAHLGWQPAPDGAPNTVEFTLRMAYTRSALPGSAPDGHATLGDIVHEPYSSPRINFGDRSAYCITPRLHMKVVGCDLVHDLVLLQALEPGTSDRLTIRKTYPAPLDGDIPWIAEMKDCCRVTTDSNNGRRGYRVLTEVDAGSGLGSPEILMPATLGLVDHGVQTFAVPAVSRNPDAKLRYRLARGMEAGSIFFLWPIGLELDPDTGVITWDTSGRIAGSEWSLQVVVEEYDTTTMAYRGRSSVDFQLRVHECLTTNLVPEIVAPALPPGGRFTAMVGHPFSCSVEASDPNGENVQLCLMPCPRGTRVDPGGPSSPAPCTLVDWTPSAQQVGRHLLVFSASDGCASSMAAFEVDVAPDTPPDVSAAVPSVDVLWPPDHRMVPVSILGVTDADGDPVTIEITGVRQDEPTNAPGDGATCPDATFAADVATLRAERSGRGDGRVYHVAFTARDGAGGETPGEVLVCVPRNAGDLCADGGALHAAGDCAPACDAKAVAAPSLAVAARPGEAEAIEFSLPEAVEADVSVFDVAGRRVATLARGAFPAGTHAVTLSRGGLANGIYFVRLRAGAATVQRRMIVLP